MLTTILSKISLLHLNMLFLIGLSLFGGTIGGRFFQKLKIPQVVGYIIIGIIIGQSGLKMVDSKILATLEPFSYFALGLIGFMVGGELKLDVFKKYGKQFIYILFYEALTAFFIVSILIFLIAFIFTKNILLSVSFGIILGSIASATAAAGTTDVLWEYKAKGPLTTILMGIVALDDILALFLFAISASIASVLLGVSGGASLFENIIMPVYEIGGAIVLGSICGFVLTYLLKKYSEEEKILTFSIGGILFVLGLSIILKIDMILSSMVMGVILTNGAPKKSKTVFELLERVAPPIYVLFFVTVGAKLNFSGMSFFIVGMVILFLLGRTAGKMFGAMLGAKLSEAGSKITKYLPLCLLSQSGVAIGLSIIASQKFSSTIGDTIIIIVTTTTFIVQILGPIFVKAGITKAGEAGLNISEEDIIKSTKIKEIMDTSVPKIPENMNLKDILHIFSSTDYLYYPVIDNKNNFIGIITVDNIRNTLMHSELNSFLLAHDLMEHPAATVSPGLMLTEANEIFKKKQIDYLPVINESSKLQGFLESRKIKNIISKRILELQLKSESLEI